MRTPTTADSYAAAGDADGAEVYGDAAETAQENADSAGVAGEDGAELAETDPSSAVSEDAPVEEAPAEEAPVDDTSTVDDDSSAS